MRSGIKKTSASKSTRGAKRASGGSRKDLTSAQLNEMNKRLQGSGLIAVPNWVYREFQKVWAPENLPSIAQSSMPASTGDGSTTPPK